MSKDGNNINDLPEGFFDKDVVQKAQERRILRHPDFEVICSKYWHLVRAQKGANLNSSTIGQKQYTELMKRVLKVLLPLYRETEMSKEIAQEWVLDACGEKEMGVLLFQKALFRVAHTWATHVDIAEYIELLEKLYDRITVRQVTRGQNGLVELFMPTVIVEIKHPELISDPSEWEDCPEGEVENEDIYEYQFVEDDKGNYSKVRRVHPVKGNFVVTSRDPLLFTEKVAYFLGGDSARTPTAEDICEDVFADMRDIYPLGYCAEQYLVKLKNDVSVAFIQLREQRQKNLEEMTRAMRDNQSNANAKTQHKDQSLFEKDPGQIEERGFYYEETYSIHDHVNGVRIQTYVHVKDTVYNQLRDALKTESQLIIRPEFQFPTRDGAANKYVSLSIVTADQQQTQINLHGFNPALERRLNMKMVTCQFKSEKKTQYIDVNYMIVDPIYETAYRSDVRRVETSAKMSIKPVEGQLQREQEFNPVTITYRELMHLMIELKFKSLNPGEDVNYNERSQKLFVSEQARREAARTTEHLTAKGIDEVNHQVKIDDLRHKHGPFYQLVSKEGIFDDDFVNCGTMDLIEYANKETIKVFIIGKPRSGKSTLARNLAKTLDLKRVSVDSWVDDFLFRLKDRIENPPDIEPQYETIMVENPETGEEEEEQKELPPPEWRTDLEVSVQTTLESGQQLNQQDIEAMIREQVHSDEAATKGFVLDLEFTRNSDKSWAAKLQEAILEGKNLTHVIEIQLEDDEIKLRSKSLRQNIETCQVYSKWERDELRKPKPVELDENGDVIPPEYEDDELDEDGNPKKKVPDEDQLVTRVCDEPGVIADETDFYSSKEGERKACSGFIGELFDSTFVRLDAAGLNPTELCDAVTFRVRPKSHEPLRPIPHIIEGGAGDFKSLLTDEGDEETNILPRTSQWSLWRTTDPVALQKGNVEEGSPEYAVHFANNVFVFQTEENMNEFVKNPRKFISSPPEMPSNFRILMLGPQSVGKKTQASKLAEFYDWRVVNFQEIVQNKMADLLKQREKLPNNIVDTTLEEEKQREMEGRCSISMSQEELDKLRDGHSLPAWKFLPWILEYLEVPMKRRPIVPKEKEPEPDVNEMDDAEKKAYALVQKKRMQEEAKRNKEQAEKDAAKADRDKRREEARAQGINPAEIGLEDTEEELIIDDLPIDQLIIAEDAKIEKIILLGFPQTETHVEKLKEYGFGFDRLLYLTCLNDEEPGKEIVKRNSADVEYNWEEKDEESKRILAFAQEIMTTEEKPGEDSVVRIDCNGTPDEVFIKIRTAIDPFFLKPDNVDNVLTNADMVEDDDGITPKLPRSDFGDYCPVTFVDEGYMVKGDPEKESLVFGKTYLFAGEKEQEIFNTDPVKYMVALTGKQSLPLQPPPPKIMIIGNHGAGTTTQIRMLCDKFKLEEFELQREFLAKITKEQEKRQRLRSLKRGFKPMEVDDEGIEQRDDEIMDDPPEYEDERENNEKRIMAEIFDCKKSLVIDGHWTTIPEEAVQTSLQELLGGSKRMPEIVIVLKCNEKKTFERTIDNDQIKAEFDKQMEARMKEIETKRAEARKATLDEKLEELKAAAEGDEEVTEEKIQEDLDEHMNEWDENQQDNDDEYAENEAPDYKAMCEEAEDKAKEQVQKDLDHIEEFVEQIKEKNVEVIEGIDTSDISAQYVHIKVVDKLKDHLKFRHDLIERELAKALPVKEVNKMEQSYTFKHSKFGLSSPITQFNPQKTKEHAVLYRERIYFLSNREEQEKFLLEPSKYVKGVESVPQDLVIKPRICVIGQLKSGKKDVSSMLSRKTGVIHLRVEEIIEDFITRESSFAHSLANLMKVRGKEIDDLNLIQILSKRLERRDCREHGWVLEDFPKTRVQAKMMAQRGILPSNVFCLGIPFADIFQKSEENKDTDFDCNREILKKRLDYITENLPQVLYFYQKYYNSVTYIDGMRSRWFIEDSVLGAIQSNIKARQCFARDFYFGMSTGRPCIMGDMHVAREIMKQSLSQFSYFCPVSFKNSRTYRHSSHQPELAVLYHHMFFYFAGPKERDAFVKNPDRFTQKIVFSTERHTPRFYRTWKAVEIDQSNRQLDDYCPVTLTDEEKFDKGSYTVCVCFDHKNFVFANVEKAFLFFTQPHQYFRTQLPVKQPAKEGPVNLYNLHKQGEGKTSVTFLEQALSSVVTKGLREVGESRLKYPTLSIKETSLKLFALFLKVENPANTDYMRSKYNQKCKDYLDICTISEELHELAIEKEKKQVLNRWPQFKEDYYNELGRKYDEIMVKTEKDRAAGFWDYMK